MTTIALALSGLIAGCIASNAILRDVGLDRRFDPSRLATDGIGVFGVVSVLDGHQAVPATALAPVLADDLRRGGYPYAVGAEQVRSALGDGPYAAISEELRRDGFPSANGLAVLAAAEALPRYLVFVRLETDDVDIGWEDDCQYARRTIGGRINLLDRVSGLSVWNAGVSDSKRNQSCDYDDDDSFLADFIGELIVGALLPPSPPPVEKVADGLLRGVALVVPKPAQGGEDAAETEFFLVDPNVARVGRIVVPVRASWTVDPATEWYAYRESRRASTSWLDAPWNTRLIAVGTIVRNYSDAYLGHAFGRGDDLAIEVQLTRFGTDADAVDLALTFTVRRNGDLVFEGAYREEVEEGSLGASLDEGLDRVFTKFVTDVRDRHGTWIAAKP